VHVPLGINNKFIIFRKFYSKPILLEAIEAIKAFELEAIKAFVSGGFGLGKFTAGLTFEIYFLWHFLQKILWHNLQFHVAFTFGC